MSEALRAAFLASIRETPDDDAPRLIYADWLDDHDEGDRADFIRFRALGTRSAVGRAGACPGIETHAEAGGTRRSDKPRQGAQRHRRSLLIGGASLAVVGCRTCACIDTGVVSDPGGTLRPDLRRCACDGIRSHRHPDNTPVDRFGNRVRV